MTTEQAERGIGRARDASVAAARVLGQAYREWGVAFRAERQRKSRSLRSVARAASVSAPFLSDVETGRRNPTEKMRATLTRAVSQEPK